MCLCQVRTGDIVVMDGVEAMLGIHEASPEASEGISFKKQGLKI